MVQIAGSYELTSEENYIEYLKSVGLAEDKAKSIAADNTTLVIGVDGEKVIITFQKKPVTFILNKEIEESLPSGQRVKSTAKLDGNKLTISTKISDALTEERVLQFSESGLVSNTSNSKGVKAKREYKRV